MLLAGVDLAWQSEKNTTAIAIGRLEQRALRVEEVFSAVDSLDGVANILLSTPELRGVAIDASLIINNRTSQRACEKQLSRAYSSRKAACHPSNLTLYPDPASVRLSNALQGQGFQHLGIDEPRWQIECYPHPAMIELFNLPERLLYKKGPVVVRKEGQACLGQLIKGYQSQAFTIELSKSVQQHCESDWIHSLKGRKLKQNEDALDAIVCLMIAVHYALRLPGKIFGDEFDGYVYVPKLSAD